MAGFQRLGSAELFASTSTLFFGCSKMSVSRAGSNKTRPRSLTFWWDGDFPHRQLLVWRGPLTGISVLVRQPPFKRSPWASRLRAIRFSTKHRFGKHQRGNPLSGFDSKTRIYFLQALRLGAAATVAEVTAVSPFDFIWLDYCGPWSKSKYASVEQIVHRRWLKYRPKHNPWLGITLMEGLDVRSFQDFLFAAGAREVPHNKPHRNASLRIGGVARWINAAANVAGQSAELKMIYRYRDRSRSNTARPMSLFLFEMHDSVRHFDVWKDLGVDLLQESSNRFFQHTL